MSKGVYKRHVKEDCQSDRCVSAGKFDKMFMFAQINEVGGTMRLEVQ